MDEPKGSKKLANQRIDYVTAAAKAALGAIPFAGSLLVELASMTIPNQRLDRIVQFAEILEDRLSAIEDYVRTQLADENFTDLLEEGLRQAARSLSYERKEYIANLITNSISQPDIEYFESKHLMRMLEELNDIEIIWLRFYLHPGMGADEEYRQKHATIIAPVHAALGGQPNIYEKAALQDSYKEHLSQLGLLRPRYQVDMKTKLPEYEQTSGRQKISYYEITTLGRLLLRQIGLTSPDITKGAKAANDK